MVRANLWDREATDVCEQEEVVLRDEDRKRPLVLGFAEERRAMLDVEIDPLGQMRTETHKGRKRRAFKSTRKGKHLVDEAEVAPPEELAAHVLVFGKRVLLFERKVRVVEVITVADEVATYEERGRGSQDVRVWSADQRRTAEFAPGDDRD